MIERSRSLKLHKKCKRGRHRGIWRVWLPSNGIHNNNLITVARSVSNICEERLTYQCQKIKISLSNAWPLKRKELAVENHIHIHAIDAMVITETWLNEDDNIWKTTCCLNSKGLHIDTVNRKTGQRGGSIGLIWNENIKCKRLITSETKSFKLVHGK